MESRILTATNLHVALHVASRCRFDSRLSNIPRVATACVQSFRKVPFGKIMRCSSCLIIVSIAQPQQGCFLSIASFGSIYKLGYQNSGLPQDKVAPWIHKLVFDKIKHAFGGRVRLMLSGSAPLSMNMQEFLRYLNLWLNNSGCR
ncbi:eukaryotic long-chain fatty acid CoA synthetase (LC-FACS) [Trifolium repens]|nr:eukaryotic long-chain fatty acid CoA synthetase (LC-FACS) [Trifolium repens]